MPENSPTVQQLRQQLTVLRHRIEHLEASATASQQDADRLRTSDELHRLALENLSDTVMITDDAGTFTYICPNINLIFGFTADEVRQHWTIAWLLGDLLCSRDDLQSVGEIRNIERSVTDKFGGQHVVLVNVKAVAIQGGTRLYVCRDITERKHAEEVMRRQAHMLQQTYDAIVLTSLDGVVQIWNGAAEGIYGYAAADMVGHSLASLYFPDEAWLLDSKVLEPVRELGHYEIAMRQRHKTGDELFIALRLTLWRDATGAPLGIIGCAHDITEQRRTEAALLTSVEQERRRIGQEMHDDLGQRLTGLALLGQGLVHKLQAKSLPEAAEAMSLVSLANQTALQARNIVRGLYPIDVDRAGLRETLSELATTVTTSFGIPCRVEGDISVPALDPLVKLHLYRIVQESVQNAIKHAAPQRIVVRLTTEPNELVLEVQDDGRGIPDPAERHEALGLRNMRYRANHIGAEFSVQRRPEGGTRVRCALPLPPATF